MSTDWSLCFICQKKTKEELRSSIDGWEKLSLILPKFYQYGAVNFDFTRLICKPTTDELLHTLTQNAARYHHSCQIKYSNSKLDRTIKKFNKESNDEDNLNDISSPPCKKRFSLRGESSCSQPSKELSCCFCREIDIGENLVAAGTFHAKKKTTDKKHVSELTKTWIKMASVLEYDDLLKDLAHGDIASNELYYHKSNVKCCYQKFRNSYNTRMTSTNNNITLEEEWIKCHSFNKVCYSLICQEHENPGTVYIVKELEELYFDLLRESHIAVKESHVSRFADSLTSFIYGLEKRTVKNRVTVYFKSKVDKYLKESIDDASDFIRSAQNLVMPLRKLMEEQDNSFDGSFKTDCQQKSVPIQLLTVISMLIDGVGTRNKTFSQQSLTLSQLIQSNFKKNRINSTSQHNRLPKKRETPVVIYNSLKLYGTVRSKTLIDHFFHLGICVSYDRVLEITKKFADDLVKEYDDIQVFCPRNLRKNVFSVIAKDNIDHNARSTTASIHYHGTSMTVMQFLSTSNKGEIRSRSITSDDNINNSKKVLPIPSSYIQPEPFYLKKDLYFAPVSSVNIPDEYLKKNDSFNKGIECELNWLNSISLDTADFSPWATYHSQKSEINQSLPGENALLPLIPQPVHTLQTQYHCMNIIKRTTNILNPGQTPVDCCDAPVFALTKEIQFRLPNIFGADKYFSLFGGLHVEQHLLIMHGELIKGSGISDLLQKNEFSIIGTGAAANANHIKQARYCLQVIACVIYVKLKEARDNADSNLSPFEWLKKSIHENPMCNYWYLILQLELEILIYIRSLRQGNFLLHIQVLKNLMKWFFALDHYHYARWLTVHLYDLMTLKYFCPDIHNEFENGNFVHQKTARIFSKISPDQVHEQNNSVIKGLGGAIPFLNRENDSGLTRWELSDTEVARVIDEFEERQVDDMSKNHHENTPAFHKRFVADVKKLESCFPCNPFQLKILSKIDSGIVYDTEVDKALRSLLSDGEKQFQTFFNNRLVWGKEAINKPIKLNSFLVPGKVEDKEKTEAGKLNYPPKTLTKLREAIHYRPLFTKEIFSTELFGVAQSIAETSESLYHGTKSDLLKCFSFNDNEIKIDKRNSAIIHDLSILIKGQFTNNIKTFTEFANHLYNRVVKLSDGYRRCDVVADRYFPHSLKENIRKKRGLGTEISFNGSTKLPSDFKDFLGNSSNKRRLNEFLAKKFLEIHSDFQQLVVTLQNSILSNNENLYDDEDISNCLIEEADQRIVRHVLNCVRNGILSVVVCTNDTDVLVLLIANFPHMLKVNQQVKVFCLFGTDNKRMIFINDLALQIGYRKCMGLSFFHTFTGCDTVSSFYKQSKAKIFKSWLSKEHQKLTNVFTELSSLPTEITEEHLKTIASFIKDIYFKNQKDGEKSLAELRQDMLVSQSNMDLRLLPPSETGLLKHIQRAAIQGGWLNQACLDNVMDQDPEKWGWKKKNDIFIPVWQDTNSNTEHVLITCTCTKAICKNCKCSKNDMACMPFCGCKGHCRKK